MLDDNSKPSSELFPEEIRWLGELLAEQKDVEDYAKRSVSVGSKVVGGTAGALAVLATGLPLIGPIIAPVFAHGLERAGNELIRRHLTPRQDLRVGRAILAAAERARELQEAGGTPRSDGFLYPEDDGDRASSDEITEAALLAAMNSAQERKVEYIGRLLANILFKPALDLATSYQLVQTAEAISYRAFVLLKILAAKEVRDFPQRDVNASPAPPDELHSLLAESYGMFTRGLIVMKERAESANNYALLGFEDQDPSRMHLTPLGELLALNLEVQRIPLEDAIYVQTLEELRQVANLSATSTVVDGGIF